MSAATTTDVLLAIHHATTGACYLFGCPADVALRVGQHLAGDERQHRPHPLPRERNRLPLLADTGSHERREAVDAGRARGADDVVAGDRQPVVQPALRLPGHGHDGVGTHDGFRDARAGVRVATDDGRPVVLGVVEEDSESLPGTDERDHPVAPVERP
jgi:hypothetical protein